MFEDMKIREMMEIATPDGGEVMVTMSDGNSEGGGLYLVDGASSLDLIALGVALWQHEHDGQEMPVQDLLGASISRHDYRAIDY